MSELPDVHDPTSDDFPPEGAASKVERDEVDVGLLSIVGAFIGVVVFLIVVLLEAWFYNWKGDMEAARSLVANAAETPLDRATVEQRAQINSYHWINREAHVRAIPIQRAMEIMAKELAAEPAAGKK